jgi:putative Holliday junction resolvase
VLALDHGAARCGVALSDPTGTLASPLAPVVLPDSRRGIAAIVALVEAHDVSTVVVGLPLRLDGGDSAQTRIAREFAALLESRLVGVEVVLHDERFTTRQARAGDGAASEDSRAAAHLLEAWLAMPAAK